jgi:hypothetical protein
MIKHDGVVLGFWCHAVLQMDANVSEKHTASIFRDEVTMLGSGAI